MRVDFESPQGVEISTGDNSHEAVFLFGLRCTVPSAPPTFDPMYGGDPGWSAEFDTSSIHLLTETMTTDIKLSWAEFVGIVGDDMAGEMFVKACVDAEDRGDF